MRKIHSERVTARAAPYGLVIIWSELQDRSAPTCVLYGSEDRRKRTMKPYDFLGPTRLQTRFRKIPLFSTAFRLPPLQVRRPDSTNVGYLSAARFIFGES